MASNETQSVASEVHRFLSYDPTTGELRWLVTLSNRAVAGRIAGCPDGRGYVVIGISGKLYQAHRLAWLLTFGFWPALEIDHVNRNKSDNRLANLREATRNQNMANCVYVGRSTTGFVGVTLERRTGKFTARVRINGATRHLGTFLTPEDASAAYQAAASREFGQFFLGKVTVGEQQHG